MLMLNYIPIIKVEASLLNWMSARDSYARNQLASLHPAEQERVLLLAAPAAVAEAVEASRGQVVASRRHHLGHHHHGHHHHHHGHHHHHPNRVAEAEAAIGLGFLGAAFLTDAVAG